MGAVKEAENLAYELAGEIEQHGECFYEEEELYIVIGKIRHLEHLVFAGFKEKRRNRE